MNIIYIPTEIRNLVINLLTDTNYPSYGQLATVSADNYPHVRTVHFRYSEAFGTLVCACNTESSKWNDLTKNPRASGCIFSHEQLVQLRWESTTKLVDAHTSTREEQELLTMLWNQMRPDVRRAYLLEVSQEEKSLKNPCPTLGAIIMYPTLWDIYTLGALNYGDGKRFVYTLTHNTWDKKQVSIISSKFF